MIIFLNGSINSGKSTVAKLLAEHLGNCANVEIDSIREFIAWMPIDQAVPINLENAACIIKNFAQRGLNVIVPYPLSRKNYDYLMDKLCDLGTKIFIFTLAPSLDSILTNRGQRELSQWEQERIRHHYSIGINKPDFGTVIDNSAQSPEETVEQILQIIHNS